MIMPGYRNRLRYQAALSSVLILFSALLSGCSGAGAGLGTSSGTCFTALPSSYAVAGKGATLLGVRLLPASKVRRIVRSLGPDLPRGLCVVAFGLVGSSGNYKIKKVGAKVVGNFELVVYSLAERRVIDKSHRTSLPIRFAHAFSII